LRIIMHNQLSYLDLCGDVVAGFSPRQKARDYICQLVQPKKQNELIIWVGRILASHLKRESNREISREVRRMYTGTASSVERLLVTVCSKNSITICECPTRYRLGHHKISVNSASNTTDLTEREEGYAGISG